MYLENEKVNLSECFRVGYDSYSGKYILESMDTFGNNRYFIITKEQYQWFDTEPNKLIILNKKCLQENSNSNIFYFSTWEKENTYEQNKRMWKYMYISLLLGKKACEIHKKIGKPDEVINGVERIEIFKMSSNLELEVRYNEDICSNVIDKWRK